MSLLQIKTRQTYLKNLDLYTGKIDGNEGPLTRKGYLELQKRYFTKKQDIDGLYGPNTDILLRSANKFVGIKNFKIEEFKCGCKGKYCTGYPVAIDKDLINQLQRMRNLFGNSITITSGLRCQKYNDSLKGSVTNSGHTKGKAVDVYINKHSNTHDDRVAIIDCWNALAESYYGYCNGIIKYKSGYQKVYNAPNMGNATHLQVK